MPFSPSNIPPPSILFKCLRTSSKLTLRPLLLGIFANRPLSIEKLHQMNLSKRKIQEI